MKEDMSVQNLTMADFKKQIMDFEANPQEWKYLGDKPAIIDFYATWCGPCKATAPVLEKIAEKYDGRINVFKVDVDKEQELAALFGVRSIPSLLFIPMSEKPQMATGAMMQNDFERAIADILLKEEH
ncbi:thioredoxin [Alloprevotella tannerae]|uniref:thioredoxin n=1 Tax=Alloprevotella tannerae TaxID=76122 RepID=UPI0034DAFD35